MTKRKVQTTEPRPYNTHIQPFSGTSYSDVASPARQLLRSIEKKTKRRPYIRSAYFDKDKIFLTYFWQHLEQRPRYQRARRLKYLPCAIELIQRSRNEPISKQNVDRPREILHRFAGRARDGRLFFVQIKEDKWTDRKELMSVFPK